jgi:hypothetical protein
MVELAYLVQELPFSHLQATKIRIPNIVQLKLLTHLPTPNKVIYMKHIPLDRHVQNKPLVGS